jgi:tetratricopeptide (TPR) repeat protein
MTACEAWFYFPMLGVLGMLGVILTVFSHRIDPKWFLFVTAIIIVVFGCRTFARSFDYRSVYTLAMHDIASSKDDYTAYTNISGELTSSGNYADALHYAQRSVSIFPTFTNYNNLGLVQEHDGNYQEALNDYEKGLTYGNYVSIYENIASLTMLYGNYTQDKLLLTKALANFPQDSSILLDAAIFDERNNDDTNAKLAVIEASEYGQVPQQIYNEIMDSTPFMLYIRNFDITIHVP